MKAVFYPSILSDGNLSAIDKIVYSQILYRAICDSNEAFDTDGNLDIGSLRQNNDNLLPMAWSSASDLHKSINASRSQFYDAKNRLRQRGYIVGDSILIVPGVEDNFFELQTKSELSGLSLIVFSYLCHLSKRYGWVDKYHNKLADALSISPLVLANCLHRLYLEGFIQKKRKGRQVLLKTII